jgi:5-methylcytosine-specific restriction endonuclease McrA
METKQNNQDVNMKTEKDEYSSLLLKPEWHNRRLSVMNRDNNRCRNCGCSNNLQVHHKQYHKNRRSGEFMKPWEYKDNHLITLCKNCHQSGHKDFVIPIFNV